MTYEKLGFDPLTISLIAGAAVPVINSYMKKAAAGRNLERLRAEAERIREINARTASLVEQAQMRQEKTGAVQGYLDKQNIGTTAAAGLVGLVALWALLS